MERGWWEAGSVGCRWCWTQEGWLAKLYGVTVTEAATLPHAVAKRVADDEANDVFSGRKLESVAIGHTSWLLHPPLELSTSGSRT